MPRKLNSSLSVCVLTLAIPTSNGSSSKYFLIFWFILEFFLFFFAIYLNPYHSKAFLFSTHPLITSHIILTSSLVIVVLLATQSPLLKSSSLVPSTKNFASLKSGCICIGFQSGLLSTFTSSSAFITLL